MKKPPRKTLEEIKAEKSTTSKKDKIKRNKDGTFDLPDGTTIDDSSGVWRNATDIDTLIMQGEADRIKKAKAAEESKSPAETPKKKPMLFGFEPDDFGPRFG